MNNTITSTVLTDGTKIATAVPVDKKTDDKYFAINFRPIILLNCFSKIYENHIKKQLVHSMSNHLFPFFQPIGKVIVLNMFLSDFWKNGENI